MAKPVNSATPAIINGKIRLSEYRSLKLFLYFSFLLGGGGKNLWVIMDSANLPSKEDKEATEPGERTVLEDFKACRDCHLWKLMMSFYDRKGPDSWSQGIVPHFITSNTFIGKSYAKVLHGLGPVSLRFCMAVDLLPKYFT